MYHIYKDSLVLIRGALCFRGWYAISPQIVSVIHACMWAEWHLTSTSHNKHKLILFLFQWSTWKVDHGASKGSHKQSASWLSANSNLFFKMCMCVCVIVWVYIKCAWVPTKVRREDWIPWSWATGSCETPYMVLETPIRISVQEVVTLHCWAISSVPKAPVSKETLRKWN